MTAERTYQTLKETLAWAERLEEGGFKFDSNLTSQLKKGVYQTKKLAAAEGQRNAVAIYGCSQAGKSYMVTGLVRSGENPLNVQFGQELIDFISVINPAGGQESTGVVTRFSGAKGNAPPSHPVIVKVLSEIDVVALLFNSVLHDVRDQQSPDLPELIKEIETGIEDANFNCAGNGLAVEESYELIDYIQSRQFNGKLWVKALQESEFIGVVEKVISKSAIEDRIKLYKILLQQLPGHCELVELLCRQLDRIGHPVELFCEVESLFELTSGTPSRLESSLVNVTALDGIYSGQDREIVVLNSLNEKEYKISLGLLSALTQELVLEVVEGDPFLQSFDLMDFPGARSRRPVARERTELCATETKIDHFKRGKVAYLFEKYSNNQLINGLILAIGPGPQEVIGLAELVDEWVARTHGRSAEERDSVESGLFVVLTKFDQEFAGDAGRHNLDGERWSTRLHASLLAPFGGHCPETNWVNQWDSRGAFRAVHFFRNPFADQRGLIEYQGEPATSPEMRFVLNRAAEIERLRVACSENLLVQRHIANPAAVWNAAMSLNDGGKSYLLERVMAQNTSEMKLVQIRKRAAGIVAALIPRISRYYTDIAAEANQEASDDRAREMGKWLAKVQESGRLGEFLNFLLLKESSISSSLQHVYRESLLDKPVNVSDTPEEAKKGLVLSALGLAEATPDAQVAQPATPADLFATAVISTWKVEVLGLLSDQTRVEYLLAGIDEAERNEFTVGLVFELEKCFAQLHLHDEIMRIVDEAFQFTKKDEIRFQKLTSVVTSLVNDVICSGGLFLAGPVPQRVRNFQNQEILIFKRKTNNGRLPEQAPSYDVLFHIDWILGLCSAIRNNTTHLVDGISATDNDRLGELLDAFGEES